MVKKALRRKLIRDMWHNRMQFVAMILLCALGTWVFSGLDAAWRMLDLSMNHYFEQQHMTDLWVRLTPLDRDHLVRLKGVEGMGGLQARATFDALADLPHEPTVTVHAYDDLAQLNVPLIRAGAGLERNDLRGCLLEEQFARANQILVGDRFTIRHNGVETDLIVRGLCLSPEYILTANDVMPSPKTYGFMLCNARAVPGETLNEALVAVAEGAEAQAVEKSIKALYPEALIWNHDGHGATKNVKTEIDMFRSLSYLFPLLALFVAALIVLTTLTRMIENQRTQIGTLKALGYSDRVIQRHYYCYALYPSVIGALLGLFAGRESLPYLLWDMEAATMVLPNRLQAAVSVEQWGVCAVTVALCLVICRHTYRKNALEETAALLRPKPPRAGRKLFLERIPGAWQRIDFNGKMVIRNLLRNKLRTLMSFVGVMTCTMLLVTTLGLQDSVHYFVGLYFEGTIRYTVRANLTGEAGEAEAYQNRIEAERIDSLMERMVTLSSGEATRTTLLTVMDSDQKLLHLGKNETYFRLPENGITLTRKLAGLLQVKEGDSLRIFLPGDDQMMRAVVSGICDINIGQGAYMSRREWESQRKSPFMPTALMILNPSDAGHQRLRDLDEVDSLRYPKVQMVQQLEILQSMTGIFGLMSIAALSLAFVVLYNMGILNFMERYREYATLKVLGYHQKEIRGLMRRENDLIAVLGALMGLWPGRWLTAMVLKTCEGDQMVFVSTVNGFSYVIAAAVTVAFSAFVTWLLTRKVKNIDMVEALKSVE